MKRKTNIITEEYDTNGALKNKITETTEEEDTGYIYPQSLYSSEASMYSNGGRGSSGASMYSNGGRG